VLLIDADLGLGNIDVVLGLTTRFSLYDVVLGHIDLADILVEGPGGVWVLPAGSGVYEMTCLNDQQRYTILDQIDTLEDRFDTVLIDNSAGITPDVQFFAGAAHEVIVVTDREPTALTDAYATIKILCQRRSNHSFHLLVNNVNREEEGLTVYRRLTTVTNRFLDVSIDLLGSVPRDDNLNRAVMVRQALVDLFPNSPASLSLDQLATKLLSTPPPKGEDGGMKMFWERLLRQNAAAALGGAP
jgi:flagellar biosynthesis protein FlhG